MNPPACETRGGPSCPVQGGRWTCRARESRASSKDLFQAQPRNLSLLRDRHLQLGGRIVLQPGTELRENVARAPAWRAHDEHMTEPSFVLAVAFHKGGDIGGPALLHGRLLSRGPAAGGLRLHALGLRFANARMVAERREPVFAPEAVGSSLARPEHIRRLRER